MCVKYPPSAKFSQQTFYTIVNHLMKYLTVPKCKKEYEEYDALTEILDWIVNNQKTLSNYPKKLNLVNTCLELLDQPSVPYRTSIQTIVTQSQIDRKMLCSLIVKQHESTIATCLSLFRISTSELERSPCYPASPLNQSKKFSFDTTELLIRKSSVDKSSVRYSIHLVCTANQFISMLPFARAFFPTLFRYNPFHI